MDEKKACLILAAGEGKRMKSRLPKVLHPLCGKPMVFHVLDCVERAGVKHIAMVVGHKREMVKEMVGQRCTFIYQKRQLGTGQAVASAREHFGDFDGDLLIVYGDNPLLRAETLSLLFKRQREDDAVATILTARLGQPKNYGRVIRNEDGQIERIVEEEEAREEEKGIKEINSGVGLYKASLLFHTLEELKNKTHNGQYFLPDVIEEMVKRGMSVSSLMVEDSTEAFGVNNLWELSRAERLFRWRLLKELMLKGVSILDPVTTYISAEAQIGPNTVIMPGTMIQGKSVIGEGCKLGPYTFIEDCHIEKGVEVTFSYLSSCQVKEGASIGPFAHIRPETVIGEKARVGNFVEVKKSILERGSKASHLSYLGDAHIGPDANIGAGTITANFDGKEKHKTIIGEGASIGSGTVLVAPVKIGKRATTGAGAVVTKGKDVADGEVVVGVPARPLRKRQKEP